jgi:hypothetical protein
MIYPALCVMLLMRAAAITWEWANALTISTFTHGAV